MKKYSEFGVRRLERKTDLGEMANLIELCFGPEMDPDAKNYLNFLRKLADKGYPKTMAAGEFGFQFPFIDGFICRNDHQLIGNLNMMPFHQSNRKLLFLSNIAVHPDFRRNGIGRRLIQAGFDYARTGRFSSVWLQVRKGNEIALKLYTDQGFNVFTTRDTWVIDPSIACEKSGNIGLSVQQRTKADWKFQKKWLSEMYPQEIQWLLDINPEEFNFSFGQQLINFIQGKKYLHLSIFKKNQLIGVISWQAAFRYTDSIWLAMDETTVNEVMGNLFQIIENMRMIKKLSIDLPEGLGVQPLLNLGGERKQTLIWMKKDLPPEENISEHLL
jgi:ribosomal protein S18 acetylase RimI-like enzyme